MKTRRIREDWYITTVITNRGKSKAAFFDCDRDESRRRAVAHLNHIAREIYTEARGCKA